MAAVAAGGGHILRRTAKTTSAPDATTLKTSFVNTTDTLEQLRFPGGFMTYDPTAHTFAAHYLITDYLGSTIAVLDTLGHVEQRPTYYPYGEPHRKYSLLKSLNRHLFGGKEYLADNSLNEYFYEARNHAPAFPHFNRQDSLAEKYYDKSPYLFCAGNPIMFTDETGDRLQQLKVHFQSHVLRKCDL